MEVLELSHYLVTYTLLVLAIFLQLICYRRNLEYRETIFFTGSLLLLVVAITVTYLIGGHGNESNSSLNIPVLLAMVLVGLTTPLNIMAERKHHVPTWFKPVLFSSSGGLAILVILAIWIKELAWVEYAVAIFLGTCVVFGMLLLMRTQPKGMGGNRERIERNLAMTFLVLIPLTMVGNYVADLQEVELYTGFTLPTVFILLAGSKIWDDVQRLGLFRSQAQSKAHRLEQYPLTKREKEVAGLLVKGASYKEISEQLFVSLPTIKTHASNVYRKCKVKSRAELMALIVS